MSGLYLTNFGSSDDDRPSPHEVTQARIRPRYVALLVDKAGLDEMTADLVIATLFDTKRSDGSHCFCGCHPHFSSFHDDGFDCACSWSDERRAQRAKEWKEWMNSPESKELQVQLEVERSAIAQWVAGNPGITAEQTTSMIPEQWEGTVDGHSFYFRERHDRWRLEIDLEPTGRFATRIVGTNSDGSFETEPESINEGRIIAEGSASQLPTGTLGHLEFIVHTIRAHLFAESCDHAGALFYCPQCGKQMSGPV